MHPIIEDHINLTEPPAMVDLYQRAHRLFDVYGMEDAHQAFEDLMVSSDGSGDSQSVASNWAIHQLTVEILNQILLSHQIALRDDASLEKRVVVLEFIKALDQTELIIELRDALECEEFDNADKLARCMLIVCSELEEDSLLYLEPVPDCVIIAIKEFIDRRCAFEEAVEPLDPQVREIYREFDKYSRAVGGASMRCHAYLFDEEGVAPMPFEKYFFMNEEYLMALKTEDMLLECIGFSIMSEDGFDNPSKVIMETLTKYVGDLNALTSIHMKLQQTLLEYRNEIASGVTLVQ